MGLSSLQIQKYHDNGFLIVEDLFTSEEVNYLKSGIQKVEDKEIPSIIREEDGLIRSIFAPHLLRPEFDWLYRQERLVISAQQLLNDPSIYLYQYKLNNKAAFKGGLWEWHQDFPFWHIDDGVQKVHMLSVMVLLQDTDHPQGPLMFIPKSHKEGIANFAHKEHLEGNQIALENSLNGDLKFTINNDLIRNMVDQNGITPGIGKSGTAIFFHPNVYHGSNANISPYHRRTAIMTYNAISNLPEDRLDKNRPNYICLRDYSPIVAIN